ncbi:hypothetical protein NE237_013828 [Protea cynaroides]|uniref:Jacalin-type lectin domain-containing protein n=1 Tax=Protea cynaroides TaxID=273540 RepID=A0A9Q0H0N0_9MAGN|nr:hypothetical protein NE237_013828 [Protea cynaroides]
MVLEFPVGSVLMERHGGGRLNFRMFILAEDDSIILVRGSYISIGGGSSLKSLSIRTTLGEYGPYKHDPNIRQFNFEVEAGKFMGYSLGAIDIYMHTEATVTLEEIMEQGGTIDKILISSLV